MSSIKYKIKYLKKHKFISKRFNFIIKKDFEIFLEKKFWNYKKIFWQHIKYAALTKSFKTKRVLKKKRKFIDKAYKICLEKRQI